MDWQNLVLSCLAVFIVMYIVGFCISLLSSTMQCGKTSMSESGVEAITWASVPTIVYTIASIFTIVRNPFSTTLQTFGIPINSSEMIGIGYLMMLSTWVTTVWVVHNTERAVCVPSTAEMTAFKTQLLKELAVKQAAEEKNKTSTVATK
jgi:hypothetical protein